DIAQPNAEFLPQLWNAVSHIQRVHLQRSRINQEPWPNELLVHVMFAQHVANVLAEITFNALAELLHPLHILRRDAPGAVFSIRAPWLELGDALFHFVIP